MLAKGNRSAQVTEACKSHGGFYLGSIGSPTARLALDNIRHVEVLEYHELGMEAVWKIDVEDFPAFIVVDDKGNDFFELVRAESRAAARAATHPQPAPSRPNPRSGGSRTRYHAFCGIQVGADFRNRRRRNPHLWCGEALLTHGTPAQRRHNVAGASRRSQLADPATPPR